MNELDVRQSTEIDARCKFNSTSLELPESLDEQEWTKIGEYLGRVESGVMWWMGDWWRFGERYGSRVDEIKENNYSHQTFRDAGWVAEKVDVSRRKDTLNWSHHKEVASLNPELQDEALTWAVENNESVRNLRKHVRWMKADQKHSEDPGAIPDKYYRVIYADPPWSYSSASIEGHGVSDNHYRPMTLDDICDLSFKTRDDAVLFLWACAPLLPDAFTVIESWGFTYKAQFIWDKIKHNMGHYNSVRHELLLIATKGSCLPDVNKLHDSVASIERTVHSAKPEYFRELIDSIYPNGPRLELFARTEVPGWDVWGNQSGDLDVSAA